MANGFDPRIGAAPRTATTLDGSTAVDAGLRSYMLSVYNYMASGVLLTGIVALAMAYSGAVESLISVRADGRIGLSALGWIVSLAPLGLVFWLSFGINRMAASTARAIFWAYAAIVGASLSTLLLVYTGTSVAQTFFATAAAFGSLSLWGYSTKRDLSAWGSFLLVGLVGLVVAGLTAYDTQKIKSMYFVVGGTGEASQKTAIMGALTLYLDFINMFLFLLRLFGDRR